MCCRARCEVAFARQLRLRVAETSRSFPFTARRPSSASRSAALEAQGVYSRHCQLAKFLRRILTACVARVSAATWCASFLHQSGTSAAQCSPVRAPLPTSRVRRGSTEVTALLAEAIFSDMLRSSPLAPYVEVRSCV